MNATELKRDLKEDIIKLEQPLKAISKKIEEMDNLCQGTRAIDDFYSDFAEDLKKEQKLNKKQAKEKAMTEVKAKMPNLVLLLESIDQTMDGMSYRIQETLDKIEYVKELLVDVEQAKSEIEEEITGL